MTADLTLAASSVLTASPLAAIDLVSVPACAARVWIDRSTGICLTAAEYGSWVRTLPAWRAFLESERQYWMLLFGHVAPDRFGVLRRLFLGCTAGGDSSRWLFALGFVHLTNLTAFYWVAVQRAFSALSARLARRTSIPVPLLRVAHALAFLSLFFFFWGLAGLKRNFLRSLILLGIAECLRLGNLRVSVWVGLALFIGIDFAIIGIPEDGNGLLHYALALIGGRVAFAAAKKSGRSLHLTLSLYTWLACIPLEWSEDRFSPFTPIFSLLTLPLLSLALFPLFVGAATLHAAFSVPGEWIGLLAGVFDHVLAAAAGFASRYGGGVREVTPATLALAGAGAAIFCAWRYRRSLGQAEKWGGSETTQSINESIAW